MPESLPPHPPLRQYYGDPARREQFVRNIFDETAEWYDSIIAMLSLGSGNLYRRMALERTGLRRGMRLLDLATGTGVLARAASTITSEIITADASIGMLLAGRDRTKLPAIETKGERLSFRDESFDMLSIGYALRHFADLRGVFEECRRVLKPGGTILILEITPPRSRLGHSLLRFHLNRVVPLLARLRSRSHDAEKLMHYFWDTIETCVPPETILDALRAAGFEDVKRHVELGTFSEYGGTKPGSGPPTAEELIDVLTDGGAQAGTRKSKSAVHRDGDWHRASHVWIVTHDGRVILQLRSTRKTNYPGMWDVSSAGHLSAGETSIEAAVRETREEIGIALTPEDLKPIGTFREQSVLRGGTYIDNEIHDVFLVRKNVSEADVELDPVEVADVAFVPVEEFRRRVQTDETLVPHGEEYAMLLRCL